MNDMRTVIRLLKAIREAENAPVWSPYFVSEEKVRALNKDRDILAIKLQKAGLIEGLKIQDGSRNNVIWEISEPEVTLKGIEYLWRMHDLSQSNR